MVDGALSTLHMPITEPIKSNLASDTYVSFRTQNWKENKNSQAVIDSIVVNSD